MIDRRGGYDGRPLVCVAAIAIAFLATSACAATRSIVASPSDWSDYRAWRLADRDDARLAAADRYLHDQRGGAFRDEISAWLQEAEPRFYARQGHTPDGARRYLEVLPHGPHADDERLYLAAWEREQREGPARQAKALAEAKALAASKRRALGDAIEAWTERAVAIRTWKVDLDEAKRASPEFATAWDAAPAPTCADGHCMKHAYFSYAIPEASPPADRVVPLVVALDLPQGRLASVVIVAPKGGFTWWMEGSEGRAIDAFDVATREEAIARAKNRVETIVRGAAKGCATDESAAVRTIACANVTVRVEVAPNGDDVVRVTPP